MTAHKLAALYLPTNEEERIGLAFRAAPDTVDALHVLSEEVFAVA